MNATENFAMAFVHGGGGGDLSLLCASGVVGDSVDFGFNLGRGTVLWINLWTWWCCVHLGVCGPSATFVGQLFRQRCVCVLGLLQVGPTFACPRSCCSALHVGVELLVNVPRSDASRVRQLCTYVDVLRGLSPRRKVRGNRTIPCYEGALRVPFLSHCQLSLA